MNNNIIINKIDVKMRDMSNFENQLEEMTKQGCPTY